MESAYSVQRETVHWFILKTDGHAMAVFLQKAALGIGSNLGDSVRLIHHAINCLDKRGFTIEAASSFYRTTPVGCAEGTPTFVNAAVIGSWSGTAAELLALCQSIERQSGRPAQRERNNPRTLDLDILLFDNSIVETHNLRIPHPRLRQRLFALVPLEEIAPDWPVPPDGRTITSLCADLKQMQRDERETLKKL